MIPTLMSNGQPVHCLETILGDPFYADEYLVREVADSLHGTCNSFGDPLTSFEKDELAADIIDDVFKYLARNNPRLLRSVR